MRYNKAVCKDYFYYKCKKGGNLEMQHGRKWLHKLLTPIVALALVLTGISFQGLAAMEAAET